MSRVAQGRKGKALEAENVSPCMEKWVLPAVEQIFGEVCIDIRQSYPELGDESPVEFLVIIVPC